MKTTFLFLLFISMLFIARDKTYCDGYEEGYDQGYCYEVVGCITPAYRPNCPVPKISFDTYKDGYNRGFQRGLKDRDE